MKKIIAGIALVIVAAGSGYVAGGKFQAPRIVTRTVTETETELVVGPVRWRTKRVPFVPQACLDAVDAGQEMAGILEDWEVYASDGYDLYEDTYNSVDDAFNSGARGEISQSTMLALDQLQRRATDLWEERDAVLDAGWNVPFNAPAADCEDAS